MMDEWIAQVGEALDLAEKAFRMELTTGEVWRELDRRIVEKREGWGYFLGERFRTALKAIRDGVKELERERLDEDFTTNAARDLQLCRTRRGRWVSAHEHLDCRVERMGPDDYCARMDGWKIKAEDGGDSFPGPDEAAERLAETVWPPMKIEGRKV